MLFNLIAGFFKKMFLGNISTLFILLFVVLIGFLVAPKIGSLFGYETRSELQAKVAKANANTEVAVEVNKHQVNVIDILEKTTENTVKVIEDKIDNEVKVIEKQKVKVIKHKEQVEKILTDDSSTPEEKAEKVSLSNITLVWSTYCDTVNEAGVAECNASSL